MWQLPAGHSESFYFWTFLTASIFFFLTYTVYATPFVAFGFEMTPDYHERTRLQAFANTAGQLAWLGVPWFYAIMASDLFEDTVHGARVLALWVGGRFASWGSCLPFSVERSLPRCLRRGSLADLSSGPNGFWGHTMDFFKGIVTTFKCRPFVKLCAATFLVFNGFQLGASFSLYVMIYYVFWETMQSRHFDSGGLDAHRHLHFGGHPFDSLDLDADRQTETFLITISLSLVGYALKWVGYNPGSIHIGCLLPVRSWPLEPVRCLR